VEHYYKRPQKWKDYLIRQCGEQPLYKTFHYKSIVYLGFSPSIFTAYLGMILKARLYPDVPRVTEEMLASADFRTLCKRMLLSITPPLPFMSLFFIAPWSMDNLFFLMTLKTLVPTLATMFLMFLVTDNLFYKYGLLNLKEASSKDSKGPKAPATDLKQKIKN
jgi:hypothetical protein